MKELKVMPLTSETFKQFGEMISIENREANGGDDAHSWYEKLGSLEGIDVVSINILEAKVREMSVDRLEHHLKTSEAIIPLAGEGAILVVAPAGELAEGEIRAFHLDGSAGVILNKGVRHFIPYPLTKNVNCVIIFRHGTGADDLIYESLSETALIRI